MNSLAQALLANRRLQLRDDEGRRLTEHADLLDPNEEVSCPYAGPRLGRPMNVAALTQIGRLWPELLADVRRTTPANATLQQAFQVTLEFVCAPLLAPENPLSAYLAVRYKACVGFCQVFAWLLLEQDDQELSALGTGREFLAWLEIDGWLSGARQVCAGTAHQIATLFDAFGQGEGTALRASPVLHVVGLQAALALSTYQGLSREKADGSLGCTLLVEGRAPWLFAVTSRPGRPASDVLRLFAGKLPSPGLDRFLRASPHSISHAERERLFWCCVLEGPDAASPG